MLTATIEQAGKKGIENIFVIDCHSHLGHDIDDASMMNPLAPGSGTFDFWGNIEGKIKAELENSNELSFTTNLNGKPTKISWNFGFRIVEKEWFLESGGFGFFADEKVSWGGGEFYVAMKAWLFGRENWAIPASPMYHIGPFNKDIARVSGYRYRLYGASGNGKQGIGILGAFYALAGNYGKEYAKKNAEGLKSQYGLDVDKDWNDARRIAKKDREFIKQKQVMSFEELVDKKPWMEGWGEDRWSQWHPARNIKQVVNLATL